MSAATFFTAQDVAFMRSNPTPQAKVGIAEKLGFHFREFPRSSSAYRMAVEIAMLLQKDHAEEVRVALSESVAAEAKTPTTLATMLANDEVDAVALPVLRQSPRLTDAILIPLIQATQATLRLMAIAARERISSPACLALIDKQYEEVCLSVLNNHAAMLDTPCYDMIVRHYSASVQVMQMTRDVCKERHITLPEMRTEDASFPLPAPANDTVAKVGMNAQQGPLGRNDLGEGLFGWRRLMHYCHQGMPPRADFQMEWLAQIYEDMHTKSDDPYASWQTLVNHMNREGALQAPVMVLALSLGLVPLFAICLARHSHASVEETMEVCNGNELDFRRLYQRTHLPSALYRLCWWTLAAAREQLARGLTPCSDEMRSAMARKLAQAEGLKINFARTIGQPVMEAVLRPL